MAQGSVPFPQGQPPVLPVRTETAALQHRLQVVSLRVELPVLPNPQFRVQRRLRYLVHAARAERSDLQHEIRQLPLHPGPPHPPLRQLRYSERHEHVRRHARPNVALAVVHHHVATHVDVRAIAIELLQGLRGVDRGMPVNGRLRHRLTVGLGVGGQRQPLGRVGRPGERRSVVGGNGLGFPHGGLPGRATHRCPERYHRPIGAIRGSREGRRQGRLRACVGAVGWQSTGFATGAAEFMQDVRPLCCEMLTSIPAG